MFIKWACMHTHLVRHHAVSHYFFLLLWMSKTRTPARKLLLRRLFWVTKCWQAQYAMYFSYRSAMPRSLAKHRRSWTPPTKSIEFISFRHNDSDTVLQIRDTDVLHSLCFTTHSCFAHDIHMYYRLLKTLCFGQKWSPIPSFLERNRFST